MGGELVNQWNTCITWLPLLVLIAVTMTNHHEWTTMVYLCKYGLLDIGVIWTTFMIGVVVDKQLNCDYSRNHSNYTFVVLIVYFDLHPG